MTWRLEVTSCHSTKEQRDKPSKYNSSQDGMRKRKSRAESVQRREEKIITFFLDLLEKQHTCHCSVTRTSQTYLPSCWFVDFSCFARISLNFRDLSIHQFHCILQLEASKCFPCLQESKSLLTIRMTVVLL